MVGTTLGHYEIDAKLGEGGMGEVFRALDTKLGRPVALKVLPADMAQNPERLARFQREARSVAALNHPHIVTIYSVEEAAGIHFLTMELIEGESLDRQIPDGGLPVQRIVAIGSALADALAAAHEKGIVHRDLKPANVMLGSDGRVKVLDFGLAKEITPALTGDATFLASHHTVAGVVLGTPSYMSPEQLAGQPVDARSDLFSLGILLYQLATGRRPFSGSTSIALASAILRDTPLPLSDVRDDIPEPLARLIRRCLEKEPERRVQTARDVGNELRDLVSALRPVTTVVSSGEDALRIVVLPFKSSGAHPDVVALAESLGEEIVAGLSRFSYLRVIAEGAQPSAARYALDGSLRQAGSQLRLAVRLLDRTTGALMWADTYNRPLENDDLFSFQDDVVPRIVSTAADMNGVLRRSMSDALRGRRADHLAPHEIVLRACGFNDLLTAQEHAEVREILERAVRVMPNVSDLWAMLSLNCAPEYHSNMNPRPDSLGRLLEAAKRAVSTPPVSQLAYLALASAYFFRRDVVACREAAERAVALNPMDGSTAAQVAIYIAYSGDWPRGLRLVEHAMQLNPHHPGWFWFIEVFDAYRQGDYERALKAAVKINIPNYIFAPAVLAAINGQLGRHAEAQSALAALRELLPDAPQIEVLYAKWFDAELTAHIMDGLRKAGL